MAEWTFRVLGEPIPLDESERRDIEAEIERLRALLRAAPSGGSARLERNPAGLVGEYASLLIEATVRGCSAEVVTPAETRRRNAGQRWFEAGMDALSGFHAAWAAVQAEARATQARDVPAARRGVD